MAMVGILAKNPASLIQTACRRGSVIEDYNSSCKQDLLFGKASAEMWWTTPFDQYGKSVCDNDLGLNGENGSELTENYKCQNLGHTLGKL